MGLSDQPLCHLDAPRSPEPSEADGPDKSIGHPVSADSVTDRPPDVPPGTEPAVPATGDAARPEAPPVGFWRSGLVTRVLGLVDQGVVSAAGFCTSVIIGRVAKAEVLGLYTLGFTLIGYAIAIHYSLNSLPYIIFSTRLRGRALAEYSGSVFVLQSILSAVVVVVLALTALFWPLFANPEGKNRFSAIPADLWTAGVQHQATTPWVLALHSARLSTSGGEPGNLAALQGVLWVLAGAAPFVLLREFARRVTMSQWRVLETVQLDLGVSFLQVVGLLGLAWAGTLSAGTAHAAVGLACALGALPWLVHARKDFAWRPEQLRSDWQRNWALGGWESGSQVVGLSQVYLILWLLAVQLDARATGIFAACVALAMLSNPFLVGIGNLLTVQAARAFADNGRAALGRVVGRTTSVIALGMIAFTVGLALFGDQLLVLLYGTSYGGQQAVLVLVVVARLFHAVGMMIDQGLLAMERSQLTFTFSSVGLVVTLAAGFALLLAGHGLLGAATGLVLGSVFATALRVCVFARLVLTREGSRPSVAGSP
jgi:O-antigen/teichoic acid export membrane protein